MGAVEATAGQGGLAPARSRDPLRTLTALPEVADRLAAARTAVDAALWDRRLRGRARDVVAYSVTAGARASAAMDGADLVVPDQSPMGRVLDAAYAVTLEAARCERQWATAPLQVLASMHAQVMRALGSQGEPGRPRSEEHAEDPMHIGGLPAADTVPGRLRQLAATVVGSTNTSAIAVAAVVHAEISDLRPFAAGSGLIARAAVRCTLVQRGVDPAMFTIPEVGMSLLGRPACVSALRAYQDGTSEHMADYLCWFADAVLLGARACVQHFDD